MTNQELQSLTKTVAFKASAGILSIITLSSLPMTPSAQAALLNPGFENGLANWDSVGNVTIDQGTLGSGPSFGNSQALLTTGIGSVTTGSPPTLEEALGLAPGSIVNLNLNNPFNPFLQSFEGTAIYQTFTLEDEDTVSFDWNFLSNDSNSQFILTPNAPRDFAFVVLDGAIVEILADTDSGLNNSNTSFATETGFQSFTSEPLTAGQHTIGIGVVDVQDNVVDSALLIDAPQETSVSTSEPTSKLGLLLLFTLGAGFLLKRRS